MKKFITLFLISLMFISSVPFALLAATGPGLPTFDFSNLVSSIESVTNAVKFYEETVKKLNDYKEKLDQFGKTISEEDFLNIINGFERGKLSITNLTNLLDSLNAEVINQKNEFNNFWSSVDDDVNSYLGINTGGKIKAFSEDITNSISTEKIKEMVNDKIDSATRLLNDSKKKLNDTTNEYNNALAELNANIKQLEDEIQNILTQNASSQNALGMLAIKSNELSALKQDRMIIQNKYDESIKELKHIIDENQEELDSLIYSAERLFETFESIGIINNRNKELEEAINSYKPSIVFEF